MTATGDDEEFTPEQIKQNQETQALAQSAIDAMRGGRDEEAIKLFNDLVVKAWTSHDGPFNFEGRFWHKRAVNVWPRPYQMPHPQVWITGSSDKEGIKKVADRGYVFATFLQPHDKVREMFDVYRAHFVERGLPGGGTGSFISSLSLAGNGTIRRYASFYSEPGIPLRA